MPDERVYPGRPPYRATIDSSRRIIRLGPRELGINADHETAEDVARSVVTQTDAQRAVRTPQARREAADHRAYSVDDRRERHIRDNTPHFRAQGHAYPEHEAHVDYYESGAYLEHDPPPDPREHDHVARAIERGMSDLPESGRPPHPHDAWHDEQAHRRNAGPFSREEADALHAADRRAISEADITGWTPHGNDSASSHTPDDERTEAGFEAYRRARGRVIVPHTPEDDLPEPASMEPVSAGRMDPARAEHFRLEAARARIARNRERRATSVELNADYARNSLRDVEPGNRGQGEPPEIVGYGHTRSLSEGSLFNRINTVGERVKGAGGLGGLAAAAAAGYGASKFQDWFNSRKSQEPNK